MVRQFPELSVPAFYDSYWDAAWFQVSLIFEHRNDPVCFFGVDR